MCTECDGVPCLAGVSPSAGVPENHTVVTSASLGRALVVAAVTTVAPLPPPLLPLPPPPPPPPRRPAR